MNEKKYIIFMKEIKLCSKIFTESELWKVYRYVSGVKLSTNRVLIFVSSEKLGKFVFVFVENEEEKGKYKSIFSPSLDNFVNDPVKYCHGNPIS